jgi:hypothetical protein
MFDAKFWEEIKEKYPNGYKEFLLNGNNDSENNIRKAESSINNFCYCDIETYFDGLGIKIYIYPYAFDKEIYKIFWNDFNGFYISKTNNIYFNSRPEAKLAAVKKAFEILQNQLKEVK